jgi:gamma-glutamyltranspeptidase/glutathione hydrolase
LLAPAIEVAEAGFPLGGFRTRAFERYRSELARQPEAAAIFLKANGRPFQEGEIFRQPLLAATLRRLADAGAMDFYQGEIAAAIALDMAANGGWITAADLADFPEPSVLPPLKGSYRGNEILTLPPPFGGWVVLQILNLLELSPPEHLAHDDAARRLRLLDALRISHGNRRSQPVSDYVDYAADITPRISREEAVRLMDAYREEHGGETTHFSVVDGDGMAVAVTQSIDSYFGSRVVHPTLGFLYNNYMQGFQLGDPAAPYALEPMQMPKSSMSASIVVRDGATRLVLGSPGSARIISSVAQVASYWIDVDEDVEAAVGAFRVHVVPDDKAYVEGREIPTELLSGMARKEFRLMRPAYGVSNSQLDPYFGGVHALAKEKGAWNGAADPRRDGVVGRAWRVEE